MRNDDPIDAALAALEEADRGMVPSARVTRAVMAAFDERAGQAAAAAAGERWRWAVAAALFVAVAWGLDGARREERAARATHDTMRVDTSVVSPLSATIESERSSGDRRAAADPMPAPVISTRAAGVSEPRRGRVAQALPRPAARGPRIDPLGTPRPPRPPTAGPAGARADEPSAAGDVVPSTMGGADDAFVELAPTTVQDIDSVRLVRVRLPEAALRHLSISPPGPPREGFVQADVVLGDDGFARAIRVVR